MISASDPICAHLIRITDDEFNRLVGFVKERYGLDLTRKRVLIEGRLTQELRRRGFSSFTPYLDRVLHPLAPEAERAGLLNRLTTNHSYFMRENEHFAYLTQHALPALEPARARRELRFWSAGCSSGQEPYHLAMVLADYFGPHRGAGRISILATDISTAALEKARAGVYSEEELQDLPDAWRDAWFIPDKKGFFKVGDRLRGMVDFQVFNLMHPLPFGRVFDVIFCRNVMIYFDGPTKTALVDRFYDGTAPGGYLFVGHSENIGRNSRYHYIQPAIYQRR